jgi:hypothetical protein
VNGRLDDGELRTQTDTDGDYAFTKLPNNAGYVIRVVQQGNAQQTTPRDNAFLEDELLSGVTPQDVIAADFNKDGAPDLAFAHGKNNEVQLWLNGRNTEQPHGTG